MESERATPNGATMNAKTLNAAQTAYDNACRTARDLRPSLFAFSTDEQRTAHDAACQRRDEAWAALSEAGREWANTNLPSARFA
jgi:hypothetical protein